MFGKEIFGIEMAGVGIGIRKCKDLAGKITEGTRFCIRGRHDQKRMVLGLATV